MSYTYQDFNGTVVFDKVAKTLTLSGKQLNSMKDIALITDVTANVIIYNFAKRSTGAAITSINSTTQVITLGYNTNTAIFSNTDEIVISLFAQIGEDAGIDSKVVTQLNAPNTYQPDPQNLATSTNVTAPYGEIATISLNAGGTGYTNGTQTFTITTGSGTATFTGVVTGGVLGGTLTLVLKGFGYTPGSAIAVTGPAGSGAKVNILTINATLGSQSYPDVLGQIYKGNNMITFQINNAGGVLTYIERTEEIITTPVNFRDCTRMALVYAGDNSYPTGTDDYSYFYDANIIVQLQFINGYKFRLRMVNLDATNTEYADYITAWF